MCYCPNIKVHTWFCQTKYFFQHYVKQNTFFNNYEPNLKISFLLKPNLRKSFRLSKNRIQELHPYHIRKKFSCVARDAHGWAEGAHECAKRKDSHSWSNTHTQTEKWRRSPKGKEKKSQRSERDQFAQQHGSIAHSVQCGGSASIKRLQ